MIRLHAIRVKAMGLGLGLCLLLPAQQAWAPVITPEREAAALGTASPPAAMGTAPPTAAAAAPQPDEGQDEEVKKAPTRRAAPARQYAPRRYAPEPYRGPNIVKGIGCILGGC
jgi:hypothetical protein